VDVVIKLPNNTRARDLKVSIKPNSLSVQKGADVIVSGNLCKTVHVDDSTWLIDAGELLIHLEKTNRMEWWENVIQGHAKIDTTKIDPENSKLGDLDGETRAMVEKMMVHFLSERLIASSLIRNKRLWDCRRVRS
jgi:hypothetical protein